MSVRLRLQCETGAFAVRIPSDAMAKAENDATWLWQKAPNEAVLIGLLREQIASCDFSRIVEPGADDPSEDGYIIRYGISLIAVAFLCNKIHGFSWAKLLHDDKKADVAVEITGNSMTVELVDGCGKTSWTCRLDPSAPTMGRSH